MKITSKRQTINYVQLTDDFYIEVVDGLEEDGFKEVWFCRKHYGLKTHIVGEKLKRVTKQYIEFLLDWQNFDLLAEELLEDNERLAPDGHIINLFVFEKTEVNPGETVREAVERLFNEWEVEEICQILKCRNCINGNCKTCTRKNY